MGGAVRSHPVSVVGGGVAGAAACIALAQAGIAPLWLAPPDQGDRDKVGESLSPAALPILAELGLRGILSGDRHRPSRATFSAWGGDRLVERNAFQHLEGPGYVIDRHLFEQQLTSAAAACARRVASGLSQGLARQTGGWSLTLDDGSTLTTDFIIDASGRRAVIGRRCAPTQRVDRLVAATAILVQRDLSVEPTPATLIEAAQHGWWYATLLPDGRLALAWFNDPDLMPRGLSRDTAAWRAHIAGTRHVARWIAEAGFAIEAPPRLASAATRRLAAAAAGPDATSGWAAVGDAAAAFDPLSSHGLTTALWTGVRAGRAAAAWLAGNRDPMACYSRQVAAGFEGFLGQRAAVYSCEQRFGQHPFWQRRIATGTQDAASGLEGQRRL